MIHTYIHAYVRIYLCMYVCMDTVFRRPRGGKKLVARTIARIVGACLVPNIWSTGEGRRGSGVVATLVCSHARAYFYLHSRMHDACTSSHAHTHTQHARAHAARAHTLVHHWTHHRCLRSDGRCRSFEPASLAGGRRNETLRRHAHLLLLPCVRPLPRANQFSLLSYPSLACCRKPGPHGHARGDSGLSWQRVAQKPGRKLRGDAVSAAAATEYMPTDIG
jgi:hypothetical protein